MKLEIHGLDDLESKLKEGADLKLVKELIKKHGSQMEAQMMRNASFKGHYSNGVFVKPTGATKRSITMETSDRGFTAKVGPKTHYAPYLEYGTRKMSAQSFVRPAFYQQRTKFLNDLRKIMK